MRVADAVVDILRTEGTRFVSTLPGDDFLPIFDALHENRQVPMNPYRVCWDITHVLDSKKTILLHDAGVTRTYVSHHYEALNPLGFIGFGGTSAMDWSTPAALGAKLGNPNKTVVNFGDGSFGVTGMEIETAARNDIRTLTVILNNESLGASRETLHERFKGHEIGISLRGDYAGVACALGASASASRNPPS